MLARQNFMSLLVKIPLFRGLGPRECGEILQISQQKSYKPGEKIFVAGTAGDEMLVLLKGRVKILISGGKEMARLEAIDTVGEMEVFGSSPRVADVVAEDEVSGLTMDSRALSTLFKRDAPIGIQMLLNIVDNLAGKLAAADQELAARLSHEPTEKRG